MSRPWFVDPGTAARQPRHGGGSPWVPPHLRPEPHFTVTIPRHGRVAPPRSDTLDLSEKFNELDVGGEQSSAYESVPVEAEGVDIPPPATSFEEMRFSAKALTENIRRCKYVKPTPIQSHAIPAAMIGRDLMACAQTGSGKTAAFCFPIINAILVDGRRGKMPYSGGGATALPLALILAPTRELSCQVLHSQTSNTHTHTHNILLRIIMFHF